MLNRLVSLVYLLSVLSAAVQVASQVQDPEAIWAQITPSSDLTWTPCYTDGMQCARLSVPLDYQKPNGPRGAVAMLRIPSLLSSNDQEYRGPVLFNPGGPGGSGIEYVLGLGTLARQILGPEYDLVGFDPRGVKRTTPAFNLFESESEALSFAIQRSDDPYIGAVPGALGRTLARSQTLGRLADARASDVGPYLSTALVARDMLSIVKAHGFEKLLYIGVSYGSLLGMTFASMFPQNVGRIVVNGILDAQDYYAADWKHNVLDLDNEMYAYYEACFQAGPVVCALYDKSPQAIKARVDRTLERLQVQPIAASVSPSDYGIVDFSIVKNVIFVYLYNPYGAAPTMAAALAALEQGNANPFWQVPVLATQKSLSKCPSANATSVEQLVIEPQFAIACSDGAPVNDTFDQLEAFYNETAKQSSFAGGLPVRAECASWKIRPVERFEGQVGGNTSSPLLFLSNTLDPITPLANAQSMSKLFPGSGLLVQNALGHTTFSATSNCTYQAIRSYVRDGVLPTPGTICEIEEELFLASNATKKVQQRDEVDQMMGAYRQFTRKTQAWRQERKMLL